MKTMALALALTASPALGADPDPLAELRGFLQQNGRPDAGGFFVSPPAGRSLLRSPLLDVVGAAGGPRFPAMSDPSRPWIRSSPEQGLIVDLRHQWDYAARNQGAFGSCTAFATVALYEAAVSRESQCTRLSEADLYMQHNVLVWNCWDNDAQDCADFVNGSNIHRMSEHMRSRGVLMGDDYHEFMGRFQRALQADAARARAFAAFFRNPFDYGALFRAPRRVTRAELSRYASESRTGNLPRQRAAMAERFRRFRVRERSWRISTPWEKSARQCRWDAREQERFLDGELLRGRPVAVSMALNGLAAWNRPAGEAGGSGPWAWHAFIINGMRVGPGGRKHYTTRNSWGGNNPAVPAEELCRIDYMQSLLVPGEREAAEDPMDALLDR